MNTSRVISVVVLSAVCGAAIAQPDFNASLAATTDDSDSRSLDANVGFAPLTWLDLDAGLGRTTSSSTAGTLHGKLASAGADVHSEHYALRGYYREWSSRIFDTDTLGARASMSRGALTASIVGEARGFDVSYDDTTAQRGKQHFSGTGWGGGLRYAQSNWAAHADFMSYEYSSLSRYVQTSSTAPPTGGGTTPTPILPLPGVVAALPVVPGPIGAVLPSLQQSVVAVAPGLATSRVTLNESALDHLYTAGVERAISRATLSLDWTGAQDAVLGSHTNSYSLGLRMPLSAHLNAGAVVGATDSYRGTTKFGGLSLGFDM